MEWVAIALSRESSNPWIEPTSPALYCCDTGKPSLTRPGCYMSAAGIRIGNLDPFSDSATAPFISGVCFYFLEHFI